MSVARKWSACMIIQKSLACVKLKAFLGHISNHLLSLILSSGVYLQVKYTSSILNQNFIKKKIHFSNKIFYLFHFLKIANEHSENKIKISNWNKHTYCSFSIKIELEFAIILMQSDMCVSVLFYFKKMFCLISIGNWLSTSLFYF